MNFILVFPLKSTEKEGLGHGYRIQILKKSENDVVVFSLLLFIVKLENFHSHKCCQTYTGAGY